MNLHACPVNCRKLSLRLEDGRIDARCRWDEVSLISLAHSHKKESARDGLVVYRCDKCAAEFSAAG